MIKNWNMQQKDWEAERCNNQSSLIVSWWTHAKIHLCVYSYHIWQLEINKLHTTKWYSNKMTPSKLVNLWRNKKFGKASWNYANMLFNPNFAIIRQNELSSDAMFCSVSNGVVTYEKSMLYNYFRQWSIYAISNKWS